jgi:hypothetical protein
VWSWLLVPGFVGIVIAVIYWKSNSAERRERRQAEINGEVSWSGGGHHALGDSGDSGGGGGDGGGK